MIELQNVSFSYEEGAEPLKKVSLHVSPGECVLLCGASGCGKTTVTKFINGLIPHFEEGSLEGRSLVQGTPAADTPLYVPDKPSSGLDAAHMETVGKTLRALAAAGHMVLVVSHDTELLNSSCDQIFHLGAALKKEEIA